MRNAHITGRVGKFEYAAADIVSSEIKRTVIAVIAVAARVAVAAVSFVLSLSTCLPTHGNFIERQICLRLLDVKILLIRKYHAATT